MLQYSSGKIKAAQDKINGMLGSMGAAKVPNIGAASPAVPGASGTKTMPAGPKMDAYAKTHFGGDATKAAAYLSTQGYK